ncbi:hypothetical protein T484DRAFT_1909513, partial [Baffinella frigidus]
MAGRVASRRFVFGGSVELDILCRAAPSEEGEAARAGEQELDGLSALRGEDVCDTIGWDLWEGATAKLCELLVAFPEIVRGKRCVEIGAGVGVVGLVAAKLGAKSVLVTDYDAGALAIANENISLNNLSHVVTTARFDFGSDTFPTLPSRGGPAGPEAGPSYAGGGGGTEAFDIVLGSDLLYSSRMASLLYTAVLGYFRGSDAGAMVMSHQLRRSVTWGPDRTPVVEENDSVLDAFLLRCRGTSDPPEAGLSIPEAGSSHLPQAGPSHPGLTGPPQDTAGGARAEVDGVWVQEVVYARALPSRCLTLPAGTSDEIG